ncbi:MAG TPA: hypothetical protein VFH88_13280, partial [Candidatus Krumholzibacteria bacterium]|nr:hypothetical protein [Candidatus Krumholzibacteria bacterium]
MTSKRIVNQRTLLILILAAAAWVRITGLNWGLPHTYEEATPLRVAVSMWGWVTGQPTTLNPSFFNYPSLSFYLHFLIQGILFLVLKLTGAMASVADWRFLYLTDPTPQYVAARLLGVTLGVMTVL